MKILLIIIDGLGDRPIFQLKNRTPLESAQTPNLDLMAEKGICGLVETFRFPKEKVPSSEGAHIALFGYQNYFLGRGPYEAAGAGIKLKKGDIALRVNFGTVSEKLKVINRRAGRIKETESLIRKLQGIKIDDIEFLIKKAFGHRAVLVLRGKNLSPKISDGDSHQERVRAKRIIPLNKSKQAKFTADVLNKYLEKTHQILKEHPLNKKREKQGKLPANYLLVRGAGIMKETPSFKKRYNLKAACIAGGTLYKGVAKIIGMDLVKIKGATGLADTNLKAKFLAVKKAVKRYNFIFLHIKATDTFSHDGDFQGKKRFIEKIDKEIKTVFGLKNILIVITADHSTCCSDKDHCIEPVPILIFGNGKDNVSQFSEKFCRKGRIGRIKQTNLMKYLTMISKKV
ncbi:2,3-bisphosphoglycerate-independent phosphoglycerate mutase [Candidatus Parcubacteria bacterium]|nr:2,3-bisphosphoglycerate-independent phosphoglycerate mutase [Candidatus Parcubacteria bacterium]